MLNFDNYSIRRRRPTPICLADGETRNAVIIDPVFEQVRRDAALIDELGLKLLYSLETHVHADHVTGGWLLLASRPGARLRCRRIAAPRGPTAIWCPMT